MLLGKKPVKSMLIVSGLLLVLFLIAQPLYIFYSGEKIPLLFPAGAIALDQRNILFIVQALMLLVILPVYVLTYIFSWKYQADRPHGKYDPSLVDNLFAEIVWWGIPIIMVAIVSVLTYIKTYELDPFKPIVSTKKEMTIQVIALRWKWLFIYPEEKIATVNFIQIPTDTPIRFEITADAPMNSFWIPSLGGQIYAMPTMKTVLNLIANHTGDFKGSSANLSGEGFAGMHFITRASSQEDYNTWVSSVKQSPKQLDITLLNKLVLPSEDNPPELFQLKDENLFDHTLNKYMHPKKKE